MSEVQGHEGIAARYREQLSTQAYGSRSQIAGVQLIELRLFGDEGGDFCEVLRLGEDGMLAGLPEYRPAQVSYALMEPGSIKAWHLHHRQDDLWFVPPAHRLLVGLLDVRAGSPTLEVAMRFTLGAGSARLLLIPRGVAHGVANLTGERASLFYFATTQFDAQHPDEHRLPADLLGTEFWSIQAG